ncbi:hypothetical protein ABBQ32_013345 [Trebouxia sp. C0010 RCD-2024]
MLKIAVQLLEMLFNMHINDAVCHVDLTPAMLCLKHTAMIPTILSASSTLGLLNASIQILKARAGRCLQKVMPACMKPPPVYALPHSQADVQPLTAAAGCGGEQARQRLSKQGGQLEPGSVQEEGHQVPAGCKCR